MNISKETVKYEFSKDENLILLTLSRDLRKLGIAVLIAGLLFVSYLVVSFLDPISLLNVPDTKNTILTAIDYGLWILIALLIIYLSIMVVHLAKPIRLMTETTGADITLLMDFLKDLTRMARLSFVALIVICILLSASLMMLILIF
jgi:hypothetical protein